MSAKYFQSDPAFIFVHLQMCVFNVLSMCIHVDMYIYLVLHGRGNKTELYNKVCESMCDNVRDSDMKTLLWENGGLTTPSCDELDICIALGMVPSL